MNEPRRFRCVLIGADTLLLECGEILLQRGHVIAAVAAGSRKVARWAEEKGIAVVDANAPQLARAIAEKADGGFEWLFSITHLKLLPDDVLALPVKGAINFHDGPLPGYAGLNTPAWALIRGEREHGISWHIVTAGVDEGDILKERRIELADNETSLSLNTRNFGLAIEAFAELVDEVAADALSRTPQSRDVERRVFSRHDRPASLCVLDWNKSAAELERLVRALDFGRYDNPLGSPKVVGDEVLAVTRVELRDDDEGVPGAVLSADDDALVVRCAEGSLALKGFTTLAGAPISPADAAARLGVTAGAVLAGLGRDECEALEAASAALARGERSFVRRLSSLVPAELPWARTPPVEHTPRWATVDVEVPVPIVAEAEGASSVEDAAVTAMAIVLGRLSGKERFHVALAAPVPTGPASSLLQELVAPRMPLEVALSSARTWADARAAVCTELRTLRERRGFLKDLVARSPALASLRSGHKRGAAEGELVPVGVRLTDGHGRDPETGSDDGVVVELVMRAGTPGQLDVQLRFDEVLVAPARAAAFARCIGAVLRAAAQDPRVAIASIDILDTDERHKVLATWNATDALVGDAPIHRAFEEQVDRTPDAVAVIFEDEPVTYRALDARANRLARHLRALGVQPDSLVGVYVERSIDLVLSVLAIHKAGGAYVPLDPTYPADRIAHMIEDSGARVILSQAHNVSELRAAMGTCTAEIVRVDADAAVIDTMSETRLEGGAASEHLAYCIYTSGSTGKPKGVLIEHRNVAAFFVGMDERVGGRPNASAEGAARATWLAVTSLSFDISVLELLYTLTRGFTVVVYRDRDRAPHASEAGSHVEKHAGAPMDFSLFYFSGDEAADSGANKYRLLLEGARFADDHDFVAVWTPERHFHAFGGLYPQPAITGAAVAAITKRVGIRAGSVVLPLHHPVRVAEGWSVVDNISNGRVGISVASGWQPNDFVLMPQNHKDAKNIMFRDLEIVKKLWRGEKVSFPGSTGEMVEVQTLPRPVQKELPVWVTTAGNPETYAQAGRAGAHVLTHLLGQTVEQLGPKIDAYRKARAEAGFDPSTGKVSLMLHTFVGDDDDAVREIVREPLKQYLGTSLSLLKQYAWAFPAFQRPAGAAESKGDELANLTPEEHDAVLEFAFERYFETSGLFGSPERCAATVDALKGIGVNEIACLIDFGVATDTVLQSLPKLDEVRRRANTAVASTSTAAKHDQSIAAQLARHQVTHMQCTPSMARMLTLQDDSRQALARVQHLFIGGEAFPPALARELRDLVTPHGGSVTNMYGPTETTVWSTTWRLPATGAIDAVPIGTPIANTRIYILDARGQPLPPAVPGELWIGGDAVVRGYHGRPELTAERFATDPFRAGRMYRTGDLARWQEQSDGSGIVEFLGRVDHQVKVRGHRIELGEIEAQLGAHPSVRECVVVMLEETPGDGQLVACLSARRGAAGDVHDIKAHLRKKLPEFMVPSHIAVLDDLPHTPNGKIDRNALPALKDLLARPTSRATVALAESDVERRVLGLWQEILGKEDIGVDENFFDIGGHSLLVVRMHRKLKDVVEKPVALTDLYRFPTIRGFARFLAEDGASGAKASADRAARRRDAMDKRRARR